MMYACFVQVATCEQVLSIEIQHFENISNAEIRGSQYCCCDQASPPSCVGTIGNLSTLACTRMCHPYFVMYFQACPMETCYFAKIITVPGEFSAESSSFVIQIPFSQSELEAYNQVRICVQLNINLEQ